MTWTCKPEHFFHCGETGWEVPAFSQLSLHTYLVTNLQGSFTNLNKAQTFVSISPTGERAGPGLFRTMCVTGSGSRAAGSSHG